MTRPAGASTPLAHDVPLSKLVFRPKSYPSARTFAMVIATSHRDVISLCAYKAQGGERIGTSQHDTNPPHEHAHLHPFHDLTSP
jgi:hypothetical protein